MAKTANDELERRRLDLALDRELEATFPASDALKITRGPPNGAERAEYSKIIIDSILPEANINPVIDGNHSKLWSPGAQGA